MSTTLVIKMITCMFFTLGNDFSNDYNYNYSFESLAKLILQSYNTSCGKKPSDYNYISKSQEELILQKVHLQITLFNLSRT